MEWLAPNNDRYVVQTFFSSSTTDSLLPEVGEHFCYPVQLIKLVQYNIYINLNPIKTFSQNKTPELAGIE